MSGELTPTSDKEQFLAQFSNLRPDLYFPESWNDEERAKAAELVRPAALKTGMLSSIPMKCYAEACHYADTCPLFAVGLAPKGKPCPIEMGFVQQFMADYEYELGVDPENLSEVSLVRDLVDQEIQSLRKQKILAKEHFIQENVVGIDQEGNPVMKKELHMAVELEDRLHRRKKDLRNQLMITREARARVGQTALDTAQALSNVLDSVRDLEVQKQKAIKSKLGQLYHDDYISESEEEVVAVAEEDSG